MRCLPTGVAPDPATDPRSSVWPTRPTRRKDGAPGTFKVLETSPGLEDLWHLHWSYNAGVEHNAPGMFVANIDDNQTIATVLTPMRVGLNRFASLLLSGTGSSVIVPACSAIRNAPLE